MSILATFCTPSFETMTHSVQDLLSAPLFTVNYGLHGPNPLDPLRLCSGSTTETIFKHASLPLRSTEGRGSLTLNHDCLKISIQKPKSIVNVIAFRTFARNLEYR